MFNDIVFEIPDYIKMINYSNWSEIKKQTPSANQVVIELLKNKQINTLTRLNLLIKMEEKEILDFVFSNHPEETKDMVEDINLADIKSETYKQELLAIQQKQILVQQDEENKKYSTISKIKT